MVYGKQKKSRGGIDNGGSEDGKAEKSGRLMLDWIAQGAAAA
jgi:hypothetical protein